MSTATQGRDREYRVPKPRGNAPLCKCGCGNRTSSLRTEYILGHRPAADPRLRFWAKVDVGTAERCWPWLASRHRNGYATFIPRHAGPRVMAHRFAYEDYRGPIADGMTIDHLCRNRACCNPWHMEVVSRGENSRRGGGSALGGSVVAKRAALTCPEGHPRTPEHARQDPDGRWRCKTCRRLKRARGDWV